MKYKKIQAWCHEYIRKFLIVILDVITKNSYLKWWIRGLLYYAKISSGKSKREKAKWRKKIPLKIQAKLMQHEIKYWTLVLTLGSLVRQPFMLVGLVTVIFLCNFRAKTEGVYFFALSRSVISFLTHWTRIAFIHFGNKIHFFNIFERTTNHFYSLENIFIYHC